MSDVFSEMPASEWGEAWSSAWMKKKFAASSMVGGFRAAGVAHWLDAHRPVRYGVGGLMGLYAAQRAVNAYRRLKYGDVLGAGVSAALAGAAGYAAYRYAFVNKALQNSMSDLERFMKWATKLGGLPTRALR
jgi:hypothetical protein